MSNENIDKESKTLSKDADNYIKELQSEMNYQDLSEADEVISILFKKIRIWYMLAVKWNTFYETERDRNIAKTEVSE